MSVREIESGLSGEQAVAAVERQLVMIKVDNNNNKFEMLYL